MSLPLIFGPIAKAVKKAFDLVDDAWDTKGEKADRQVTREEIRARYDVALLTVQVGELQAEAMVAEAQSRAAVARAQGKSWLQRTLFPITTYGIIVLIGWFRWHGQPVPIEALAVWLVVAGGGVIDRRLFDALRGLVGRPSGGATHASVPSDDESPPVRPPQP